MTTTIIKHKRKIVQQRRRNNKLERYYNILKAILCGYGKSTYYQQKLIDDSRPILRVIELNQDVSHFQTLKKDLTELIDTGFVNCESVRRRLKWNAKKAVRNGEKDMWVHPEFVTVYSVTEKGMEFIRSIEEEGGEE